MSLLSLRRKSNSFKAILFACLLLGSSVLLGQSKKELENKKKTLLKDIEQTNLMLKETKNSKKITLGQVVMLNKKISMREELIAAITSEINILSGQINQTNRSITSLQQDLKKLKAEYAKMVYFAWRNQDSYSKLMFVFASQDFSQAYMRLKYFQQYSDYRKRQADMIVTTQNILNEKIEQLEQTKTEKQSLIGVQEEEKKNLSSEKEEKEEVFAQLKDKEKQLKKDLEKKKKDAKKIQEAIEKIIKDEIDRANKENEENNRPRSKVLLLTPESQQLSKDFVGNRGKLPWPVIKGNVTGRFGDQPHPLMPEIIISNNGIDISTTKGALARAVFDGEVTGVTSVPGLGKVLIIRHGEYLSVYANLNEVFVNSGDKIKTKQNLGNIVFDSEENSAELHLEIWRGQVKLDPETWIIPLD